MEPMTPTSVHPRCGEWQITDEGLSCPQPSCWFCGEPILAGPQGLMNSAGEVLFFHISCLAGLLGVLSGPVGAQSN